MSSSYVELVRSLIDAWNDSAHPGLDRFHPDAEFDFDGWGFDVSGTFTGTDQLYLIVENARETWEQIKLDPVEFIDAGDKVVLWTRFLLRQRGSGLHVSDSGSLVFTFVEGKIARFAIYREHERALTAAGLRETAVSTH